MLWKTGSVAMDIFLDDSNAEGREGAAAEEGRETERLDKGR